MNIKFIFPICFLLFFIPSCMLGKRNVSYTGSVNKEVYITQDRNYHLIKVTNMYVEYPDGSTTIVKKVKPGTKFIASNMSNQPIIETGGGIIDFQIKFTLSGKDYDLPAVFSAREIHDYLYFDQ